MTVQRSPWRILILVAFLLVELVLVTAPAAQATNGYLVHGIGTRNKGLAGAGSALPQDSLAAAVNPAGLAFVGKRFDAGLSFFSPQREYTVNGNPSQFPGTFGLAPGTVKSDSELFFVPHFGANWKVGSQGSLGLAVYGQGGMNTDYPTNTFFGSTPTGVDLSQLFIAPTYATLLGSSGKHAIGITPILAAQFFRAEGLEAFGPFSSAPDKLTNNGHDTSLGFGVKVGYMGQWTKRFSFAIAYQSQIKMDEFSDYGGLFAEQGGFDIPSHIVAGIALKLTDNVTWAVDVQEIYYTDIASVSNPLLPNLVVAPLGSDNAAGFGWQDITVYKTGILWETDNDWTWRFGFSTTDQPIPDSEVLFNILAPGVVEEHYTFGFTRDLSSGHRALSLSLMYAPSVTVSGPNPLEVPGLQTIDLEMKQWDLEIGYSWGF